MKIEFILGLALGVLGLVVFTYIALHLLPFIILFGMGFVIYKINKLLSK